MSETRKIAAILVADVVGYSRLAGADEDCTQSRVRGLRSDLIDPVLPFEYWLGGGLLWLAQHITSALTAFCAILHDA